MRIGKIVDIDVREMAPVEPWAEEAPGARREAPEEVEVEVSEEEVCSTSR